MGIDGLPDRDSSPSFIEMAMAEVAVEEDRGAKGVECAFRSADLI